MPHDFNEALSRRSYLTATGMGLVTTAVSGCTDQTNSPTNADGGGGTSAAEQSERTSVSEYFDWEHYFTDVDEMLGGSVGVTYKIAATNATSQEFGFATRLKMFQSEENQDEERIFNKVVRSDEVAPGITWNDGLGVALASLEAVTRYTIELYVSEPGSVSSTETLATRTVGFTGEDFRSRIR